MTLQQIVQSYIRFIRPHSRGELNWFRDQNTLRAAVETAARAIDSNGKMYSHQWRVRKIARAKALQTLLDNLSRIGQSASFDDLFSLVNRILEPIDGIGELYIYDTSLRIGAKMNLLPRKVYLHAGTRVGAKALDFDVSRGTLSFRELNPFFPGLLPHEMEDVLCIFKDALKRNSIKFVQDTVLKRSWCG